MLTAQCQCIHMTACNGRTEYSSMQPSPSACAQFLRFFSVLADGLLWMIHEQGFTHAIHYLDDSCCCALPNPPTVGKLYISHSSSAETWESKSEGPSTTLTFLGIEIDSHNHRLCLPPLPNPPPPPPPPPRETSFASSLSGCYTIVYQDRATPHTVRGQREIYFP